MNESHPEPPESSLRRLASPDHGLKVIKSEDAWKKVLDVIEAGSGPIALDVERASGFRYSQRAYLVQIYRRGGTNFLVDPLHLPDLSGFTTRFGDQEWVLHAARQDLASLREVGMSPTRLFDTELGARLAGLPRVGLQGSVEDLLGVQLAKEHSAADWSTRPLPESWLNYAALDVEVLPDLRDAIWRTLEQAGKIDFATEEFNAIIHEPPSAARAEPWRRLSGLHQVRGARGLAIARELWLAREEFAKAQDVSPGRLLPDRSIVHAAMERPSSQAELVGLKNFHGRASRSEAPRWWAAIREGMATQELPALRGSGDTLPPPRAWLDKAPEAHRRYVLARDLIQRAGERITIPAENILTPEYLRRICYAPHDPSHPSAIDGQLEQLGARRWQRDLVVPLLVEAFRQAATIDEVAATH
jgi:ribonuclease D